MRTTLLLLAVVAAVVVAGCLGSDTQTPATTQTSDTSAIDSGVSSIDSGISGAESMQTELNADISDADLDLGL